MSNDKQEATGKQFYETADKIITVEKQERSYSEGDTREKPLNQNKITAVEWLEKNISLDMNPFELIECFNKAKEMEKEQSAIADVVMWLYEKHGIWINVDTLGDEKIYPKWNYKLIDLKNPNSNVEWESKQLTISYEELIKNSFNSPTEAYRAAINYTLENLIKKWAAINKQQ